MSASTEKKQRQAAREAGTDKKILAEKEAAEKRSRSRRRTGLAAAVVAVLVVLAILFSTGFFYTQTTAVRAGARRYSPAALNYHYVSSYQNWMSTYGNLAAIAGMDTEAGPFGLKDQPCPMMEEGHTWRDFFIDSACAGIAQMSGLLDYAGENGITLSEEQLAAIDAQISQIELMAKVYGYSSADHYLEANFGDGVTARSLRGILRDISLSDAARTQYTESLQYSDEELEAAYAAFEGSQDFFDYAYYYVQAEAMLADGGEVAEPNEMTLLEARMTAEAIRTSYQDDRDTEDPTERLNAAIEAEDDVAEATVRTHVSAGSLGDLAEWMTAARKVGDIEVIEDSASKGYYVVVFLGRDDNHYNTVSVRHILIEIESNEDGTWTPEADAAAREEAERILAEWKAGEATEESFAALAEQYSTDTGSNTVGGLYEDVYHGQMVPDFDAFCFGGHQHGDTTVIFGTNGAYAGYHVIYFVGEGEPYSNILARDELREQAVSAWLETITPEYRLGAFAWLAGK